MISCSRNVQAETEKFIVKSSEKDREKSMTLKTESINLKAIKYLELKVKPTNDNETDVV